jgi:hypothetical protein
MNPARRAIAISYTIIIGFFLGRSITLVNIKFFDEELPFVYDFKWFMLFR